MSWHSDGEPSLYDRDPDYCENCNRGFSKAECDACEAMHHEMECRSEGQRCETCVYYEWDVMREIFFCDNAMSEWYGEEGEEEGWCEKWQDW